MHALRAQLGDARARKPGNRAQAHQHHFGVFAIKRFHHAGVAAPEHLGKALLHGRDHLFSRQHSLMRGMLVVAVEFRAGGISDVDGMREIEAVARGVVGRQECVSRVLVGDIDAFVGMRERETVEVDHHRRAHPRVLGERVGHERQIERLLIVLRVHLDPAMVEQRQAVALVAVNVPRQGGRAVRVHHDDGEPAAGRIGQTLGHVQQTLA